MPQQIREPAEGTAAIVADAALIIEQHPMFPEWLAAFEHLIKSYERLKSAGADSPNLLDLQQGLAAAKAAYLKLLNELD